MNVEKNKSYTVKGSGLHLVHFLLSVLIFLAMFEQYYIKWYIGGFYPKRTFVVLAIFTVVFLFLIRAYDAYDVGVDTVMGLFFGQSLCDLITDVIIYGAICLLWTSLMNPIPLLATLAIQILLNLIWSYLANRWYFKKNSNLPSIVLYSDSDKLKVLQNITMFDEKYDVKEYINVTKISKTDLEFIKDYKVVFVIDLDEEIRNIVLKECIEHNVRCLAMPHIGDVMLMGGKHVKNCYAPLYMVERANFSLEYAFLKRAFDFIVCLVALIVLSPVFLITAIAIKLEDRGPAFYRQTRLTKDGREFEIIKFRSMRVDAEKDGVARLSTENDDRITKVGSFIRKCRIDELPQLINILKGEMSIVGPRPERPEIAAEYEKELEAFSARLQVKAGLTGYAQVYGKYNTNPYQKLLMDLMYINTMSSLTDLKIMFATVRILFEKESSEGIDDGERTA